MKRQETGSDSQGESLVIQSQGRHSYQKVLDGRKQPIRGLYKRNNAFLARLTIQSENGSPALKWIPLKRPDGGLVRNLSEARAAFDKLRTQERENDLPILGAVPTLADYVPQ